MSFLVGLIYFVPTTHAVILDSFLDSAMTKKALRCSREKMKLIISIVKCLFLRNVLEEPLNSTTLMMYVISDNFNIM